MDTNPFATNPLGAAGAQPAAPGYLQPQAGGGLPGNISNMVKAIMAGNAEHQAQMQKQGGAQGQMPMNPSTTTGGPSVGAPMSLAPPAGGMGPPPMPAPPPPVDPAAMTGGAGGAPSPAMPPGGAMLPPGGGGGALPGMPNGVDPTMSALFSQIPGQGGFGG